MSGNEPATAAPDVCGETDVVLTVGSSRAGVADGGACMTSMDASGASLPDAREKVESLLGTLRKGPKERHTVEVCCVDIESSDITRGAQLDDDP